MPEQQDLQSALQTDRMDLRSRTNPVILIAKEKLNGTALLEGNGFSPSDEQAVKKLVIECAPYSHPNTYPDFWRHSLAVGIYLKKASEKLGRQDLNPSEAFCIGLLHDWPPVVPHRYLRKNIATGLVLDNIGISPKLHDKFPEILSILQLKGHQGRGSEDFDKRGFLQVLGDAADNIGRVTPDGKIKSLPEVSTTNRRSQKDYLKGAIWPSERKGLETMHGDRQVTEFAVKLALTEVDYLKWIHDLDLVGMAGEVEMEYNSPENQSWLSDAYNAQETLDPQIDKKLGRPPIKTVIFDLGGVLIDVRDEELVSHIADRLEVDKSKVQHAFEELNKDAMAGKTADEDYLHKLAEIVGVKRVSAEDLIFPEIYHPVEGMQEIVRSLRQKDVDIRGYSNIIPLLTSVIREKLHEFYPQLSRDQVLFSCEINAAKQDRPSFNRVTEILRVTPLESLFIDDSESYTTSARVMGMRGLTFRGNDIKGLTPVQRLQNELSLAGLL